MSRPPFSNALRATFVMEQHLGHQTFSENLRRAVDGHGDIDARWVEVSYGPGSAVWERLPGLGDRARGALRGRAEVRRGCRPGDSEVRFFNTQVPAVLGGRRARVQPYVICTDVTPVQYDGMAAEYGHVGDADGPVSRYKHRVNVGVFRAAARNVVWSRWVRDSLIHDYDVEPGCIDVIPPGVDTSRWSPGRSTHGSPVRLLFVGGDFHRKGGAAVLRAFRTLPTGAAELIVVTRTKLATEAGVRVHTGLTPNSPDLISLFRSSDVFVMPSGGETFGIAAVEAAACGLPVVATRVGGFSDIVVDGETGFLVRPGSGDALADRLQRIVGDSDLRRRMGNAGRRRVERDFDADRNAERIIEVLRRAATRTPTPPRAVPAAA